MNMRIKPSAYAKSLISSLESNQDVKVIARSFWKLLQKNNQLKDIEKILKVLDLEYAAKNSLIIAKIYSAEQLSISEIDKIKTKLEKDRGIKIIAKNIIKRGQVAGINIKIGDEDIDLSISGNLNRLKKAIS